MIADRFLNCLLRSSIAFAFTFFIAWLSDDVQLGDGTFLLGVGLIYMFIYIKDVGTELTERLKQIGGYVDGDPEYDDDTAV